MERILKCFDRCFYDSSTLPSRSLYMNPMMPMKPMKPKYKPKPMQSKYMIKDRSCLSNSSYDSDISILSLSPICDNISPIDHDYGPPNRDIYNKCVQCRANHIENREIYTTCTNCDYTLCRKCYFGLSNDILV